MQNVHGFFVFCFFFIHSGNRQIMVSRIQTVFFLCLFVSAAFVVHEIYICELLLPLRLVKIARYQLLLHEQTRDQTPRDQLPRDHDSFLVDWCRLQRSRVDWRGLLGNCRNKMTWKQREVNSKNKTDANKSFISRWEIKPQGMQNEKIVCLTRDNSSPRV